MGIKSPFPLASRKVESWWPCARDAAHQTDDQQPRVQGKQSPDYRRYPDKVEPAILWCWFATDASSQARMISFRPSKANTLHPMSDKEYLIRFKEMDLPAVLVVAARVEFHGENLAFLKSDGTLAALFLLEIVESWSETKL